MEARANSAQSRAVPSASSIGIQVHFILSVLGKQETMHRRARNEHLYLMTRKVRRVRAYDRDTRSERDTNIPTQHVALDGYLSSHELSPQIKLPTQSSSSEQPPAFAWQGSSSVQQFGSYSQSRCSKSWHETKNHHLTNTRGGFKLTLFRVTEQLRNKQQQASTYTTHTLNHVTNWPENSKYSWTCRVACERVHIASHDQDRHIF